MPRRTPCGQNPDGTKTHYECLKTGIRYGYRVGLEKGKKKGKLEGEIKGVAKGKKMKKVYTREELEKIKKGGIEDIAKRIFKIINARKKTKSTLIEEILTKQLINF